MKNEEKCAILFSEKEKGVTQMGMPNLLIADSSEEFALSLSVALQDSFKIFCCKNGKEALDLLKNNFPDVIVLDLMLPEIDGISLLYTLRQQDMHPTILATTRLISDYVVENVQRLGIGYLMLKPCDVAAIAERVIDLCRQDPPPRAINPRIRIISNLTELDFLSKLKGYAFLQEASILMANHPGMSITKELYPSVGKIFDTTGVLVERSIRSAIQKAWEHRDNEVWKRFFPANADGNVPHPTNAQFISRIAEDLRKYL